MVAHEYVSCYLRVNRCRIRFCNKNNLGGLQLIASTNRSDMGGRGRAPQYKIPKWIWPYAAILAQQTGKRSTRAAAWPNPKNGPPHGTFLQAQPWPNPATGPTCRRTRSAFGSLTIGALDIITSRVGEFYYRQQHVREGQANGTDPT